MKLSCSSGPFFESIQIIMASSTNRRRANNNSNNSRGSSTPRRRGGRQAHLSFAPPPAGNDIAPPIPIDLDPTTRRAPSEPPSPPRPAPKAGKRYAWIFQHMPSEGIEERYYDEITKKELWRCAYCPMAYVTNGGTQSVEDHLATHSLHVNNISPLVLNVSLRWERSITLRGGIWGLRTGIPLILTKWSFFTPGLLVILTSF